MTKMHFKVSMMLGLVALVAGCSAADDTTFGDEPLDELEAALGEAGCGTVACPTPGQCASVTLPKGGGVGSTSPTNAYGVPSCPGQYVVSAQTPPTSGRINLNPLFGESLTKAQCPSARLEGALYAKENGVTRLVNTITFAGVWSDTGCVLTSGSPAPTITGRPSITEVRAVGRAYLAGPVPTPKRVRLGFMHFR